ncbi:CBS domain-containing protein [Frigidibacter sp. MR17.14]|uniref:CBS domain-containing protein n=1 Tax=Frigidibacter sp. MR17.14 TaxID=3126509 RepID=UPI003012E1B8
MLVQQILKGKTDDGVVTVAPGWNLASVAEVLSARKIGAVIVSRDGRVPMGIVSERDIVRELGRRGAICLTDPVEQAMTKKLVTCSCSDDAVAVLEKMTEGRFRHMPVMEGEEMIGLISIGDVVKARLAELAMEREALEGMIMGN